MSGQRYSRAIPALLAALLAACGGEPEEPAPPADAGTDTAAPPAPPDPYAGATVFAGATLWDGSGGAPLEDAVLIVRDGRIADVTSGAAPPAARRVDLGGRWIVPGFIDAHVHVSGYWAPDEVRGTAERLRAELTLYAHYGFTAVLSLGGEPPEAMAIRDAQDVSTLKHARIRLAGPVVDARDPAEAALATRANVESGVDWIKIRVDDNLGTAEKMPRDAIEAVFAEADAAGMRVATHVFYQDDAARLLELGSDLIAHSVRDRPADDAFVARLYDSGVCYVPTLTREMSTFVYASRPDFFDDPFFTRYAKAAEVERLSEPAFMQAMAGNPAAAAYRRALARAQDNLRVMIGSGVPVAFGTDAGPPGRFPGYFGHVELYLMTQAGLTAREALMSATSVAAGCLGLSDVGVLEAGRRADFVVLRENPLADIRNTRSIEAVYVAGNRVP